jgi:choline dehydrogenase-like flavoprotein
MPQLFGRPLLDPVTAEGLERFSCPTDFGARYRARLASATHVRVLFGANCAGIRLSSQGDHVSRLVVATLSGRRFEILARSVVIAAGGLETPRLLLASNDVQREGIGNAHGNVGRYYMCHLAGSVGSLTVSGKPVSVRHGYERTAEGIYCRRRLALTPDAQRSLGVANLAARLHFPAVADPSHGSSVLSGIFLTRRLLSHEYSRRVANPGDKGTSLYLRHMANVLRYPHDAVGFLAHWMLRHNLAPRRFPSVILKNRSNRFSLEINAEQIPLPESRVSLGDGHDSLGMQRVRVDWRYVRADIDSVAHTLRAFAAAFEKSGIGQFSFDEERLEDDLTCFGAYGGHHIGTARMGSDRRKSVVDADCRVHGIDNLFVAGSAVFPTSSQANPTLTIVALSLRLAEHLSLHLGGKPLDAAAAVK